MGDISAQKGNIAVKRYRDNTLNLEALLPPSATHAPQAEAESLQQKQKAVSGKPWNVTIKKMALDRYTVIAEDQVPEEQVNVLFDQINFKGDNISTQKNAKGKISLSLQIEKKFS